MTQSGDRNGFGSAGRNGAGGRAAGPHDAEHHSGGPNGAGVSGTAGHPRRDPGSTDSGTRPAELSAVQQRKWLVERLHPAIAVAQTSVRLRLRGLFEATRLEEALTGLAATHPALSMRIQELADGTPSIVWGRSPMVPLELTDLRTSSHNGTAEEADRIAQQVAEAPFDLRTEPPIRAHLIRTSDDEHTLIITAHHVAADDAALSNLVAELGERYSDRRRLAARPHHRDEWEMLDETERTRRLEFWDRRLSTRGQAAFPIDRQRPSVPTGHAARATRKLPKHVGEGARGLGDGDVMPVVVAAFAAGIARYTGQTDLTVGIDPIAWPNTADHVAAGPDPAPLRLDVSDAPSFAEIVRRSRVAWAEATAHRAPLIELVRRSASRRTRDRHPIFQITVNAPTVDAGTGWPEELRVDVVASTPAAIAEDLRLEVLDRAGGMELAISYASDIFDHARIARFLGHIEVLLTAAVTTPGSRLPNLPLTAEAELRQLLSEWQGPTIPYAVEPVHAQIRRRARQQPDHVAIRYGTEELTYRDLVRRAEALAINLRSRGVRREEVVAVALGREIDTFVALVGILMAGAAFLVVDTMNPPGRIAYLFSDTGARLAITNSTLVAELPEPDGWTPILLDREWAEIERTAGMEPLIEWADHDSLAYVLYTSGSTGRPKGVLIEHGPLSNFLLWLSWLFDLGPRDRMLQHMALIFDFAQGEIFTALTAGMTIVLVPEALRPSAEKLGELLVQERITYMGGTPAVLARLPRHDYPDLRYVVAGGEAFAPDLVNRLAVEGRRFVNGYGPTEAAVGCIYYECEHREWTVPPPIGRAMPNRYAYVVDNWDRLAPVGVPGEILVGGAGLARGYLNSEELTSVRFIPDPFMPAGRVYRTGDLGMWTDDGQIQFLGRIDTQVKVNGLRIEVEEIESVLTSHPSVLQSAVVVKTDASGASRLVGYVSIDGEPVTNEELRTHLHQDLPHYMVPGSFVVLDTLPLTPVGKIDRAALATIADSDTAPRAFAPARTPVERKVAEIVADVIGVARVGLNEDFYDLGGDSMRAVLVASRVAAATGAPVTVADFHAEPTVEALSRHVFRATQIGATQVGATQIGDGTDTTDARSVLDQIAAMTDEDVARLIARTDPEDTDDH